MKKIFVSLMAIVLVLSTFSGIAFADEFELRGVKFGATLDEVIAIETLEYSNKDSSHETYYFKGTLSGIEDSQIGYGFENGALKYIIIDFNNEKSKLDLERDFKTIKGALTTKYGEPLGITGGKTFEYVGNNLEALAVAFAFASLVKMSYDYNEWWIETDGGHVKIDQMYTFMPGSKGSEDSGLNSLQYTFFSDKEINSVMGDL